MRYLTIPEPAIAGSNTIPLSQLLDEQVWNNAYWRPAESAAGVGRSKMFFEVHAKFEGKGPGDVIELQDAELEAILPLATMSGQQLPPHLSMPLQKLMACFYETSTEPPPSEAN